MTRRPIPYEHFYEDGSCDCPKDGKCIECGAPCTDHDLVADWHWCGECINRALDANPIEEPTDGHGTDSIFG